MPQRHGIPELKACQVEKCNPQARGNVLGSQRQLADQHVFPRFIDVKLGQKFKLAFFGIEKSAGADVERAVRMFAGVAVQPVFRAQVSAVQPVVFVAEVECELVLRKCRSNCECNKQDEYV